MYFFYYILFPIRLYYVIATDFINTFKLAHQAFVAPETRPISFFFTFWIVDSESGDNPVVHAYAIERDEMLD